MTDRNASFWTGGVASRLKAINADEKQKLAALLAALAAAASEEQKEPIRADIRRVKAEAKAERQRAERGLYGHG